MNQFINRTNNRDLIVFAEDWGGLPSSTQQLISHLANHRKIIWVNSIGLRQPSWSIKDLKRLSTKVIGWLTTTKIQTKENSMFVVVNPKTLPAPKGGFSRFIAATLLAHQLRAQIKRHQLTRPILWISLPTAVDIIGRLNESAIVYYCCDDFSALAGVDHETVNQREQQLAEQADLILTSSKVLRAKFKGKVVVTVEHGVDYQLFSTPVQRAAELPTDKPIAGYYGSISSWLDLELLQQTINQLPQWNFVFIGEISIDVSVLRQYPNVYFLGPKPHQLLPQYCQHWQASLLPFRDNRQIRACNPFKLREYLAAARPIISTEFPALEPYESLINVVHNADQMVAALRKIKPEQPLDYRKQRAVVNQTWQARAAQVNNLLEQL